MEKNQQQESNLPIVVEKIRCIAIAVLAVAIVAALGSSFTDISSEWYVSLIKPVYQPPGIVFPIVWTILYALIAWSIARVCASEISMGKKQKLALSYAFNGVLNALWNLVFFYKQNASMALLVLFLLILSTSLLIKQVKQIDKTAALLLTPYLVWLVFAGVLNYAIAMLN